MRYEKIIFAATLIIMAIAGCRKPYNPPAIASSTGYLVVQGVINPGSDSTIISVNRTVNISSKVTANPVAGATVAVENDQNAVFPLSDAGNGNYVSPGLNLDMTRQYRLSIKTSNEQYYSNFAAVTVTPAIDSIGYNIVNNAQHTGLQVYANTHDPANKIKYYRWDFAENWQFHSKYSSGYIVDGGVLLPRTPDQLITICYSNDAASTILLASSAKLQQDVIYQTPLTFVPSTSEKLEDEYTIFVRQYALTADAYTFWTNLKKNTEQLGSIFDPEPSQINGNIHSVTNPSEPVVGYVSVSTISSKRIFVYQSQLPAWTATYPYDCQLDTLPPFLGLIPTTANGTQAAPRGYFWSTPICVDCTLRGTKIPPPFWR